VKGGGKGPAHGALAGKEEPLPHAPHAVWPWPLPKPCGASAAHQPGAQTPRPALAFVGTGSTDPSKSVPHGRGQRAAFPVPARTYESACTASMAGAIAPATVQRRHQDKPGAQSPRPAPAPPPAGASPAPGRALACAVPGPAGLRGTVPHGRGKAGRVSGSRPKGQSLSADREEPPCRQVAGLLFQHPVIPSALAFDRFGVVAARDGSDGGGVVGEEGPGFATSGDDLLVGLEDGDGGAAGAEVGPDVPDRVQLRGLWRERHQGDGAGHLQGLRAMPSGAAGHGNGVRPRRWCGKSRRSRAFMAAVPALGMTSAVALRSGQTVPDMQAQVRCGGYRGARAGDCRARPGCG
jgi:hypothetical protein